MNNLRATLTQKYKGQLPKTKGQFLQCGKSFLFYLLSWAILFLLLPANLLVPLRASVSTHASTTQLASIVYPSVIDQTEDAKAMGYPDGRKIVRDQYGHLYVAYRKKYKAEYITAYHIFVAKSVDNGATWQILNQGKPIETVGDYNQRVPVLAIDSQDTLHLVWYGKDTTARNGDENQIKYIRSTDYGKSWSVWRNIAPVHGYAGQPLWQEHPAIYIDDHDELFIVWEGYDKEFATKTQIKFLRSSDGGESWSIWQNVAPAAANHSRPTIVGSSHGTLYILAYTQFTRSRQITYVQSTDGGNSWSTWQRVAPSILAQRHVSAAFDRAGNLHLVWAQQSPSWANFVPFLVKPSQMGVYYTSLVNGQWQEPERIAAGHNGEQMFPSVGIGPLISENVTAYDGMGQEMIWVAWSESHRDVKESIPSNSGNSLYAIKKDAMGWGTPLLVAEEGNHLYPSFARTTKVAHSAAMTGKELTSTLRPRYTNTIDLVWLDHANQQNFIHFTQLYSALNENRSIPWTAGVMTNRTRNEHIGNTVVRTVGLQSPQPLEKNDSEINQMTIFAQATPHFMQWFLGLQVGRETQTVLMICLAACCYVLLKFVLTRWLTTSNVKNPS